MTTTMNKYRRTSLHESKHAPKIEVRYFYTSPLHIDDVLAPVPPAPTASQPARFVPQPFSERDNTALDKSWNELQHKIAKHKADKLKRASAKRSTRNSTGSRDGAKRSIIDGGYVNKLPGSSRRQSGVTEQDRGRPESGSAHPKASLDPSGLASLSRPRSASHALNMDGEDRPRSSLDGGAEGTTGTPFIRAPSRSRQTQSGAQRSVDDSESVLEDSAASEVEDADTEAPHSRVIVGAARLHHVSMPDLQMEPIYWSPVHDVADTTRATWFYKESMFPVESDVANMLEAGYVALRPWTQTWNDELDSAVEVGAVGEERIAHPLWPKPNPKSSASRPGTAKVSADPLAEEDTPQRRKEEAGVIANDVISASALGRDYDNRAAGKVIFGRDGTTRAYQTSSVIYANSTEAYILRSSLQPSSYYGRRPLANYIRKGYNIGICVVRGFEQGAWDAIHSKNGKRPAVARDMPKASRPFDYQIPISTVPDDEITDLVLVIHGIGQKFSERVESFHFTHAMNAFRREVNVELNHSTVEANLRKNMGGVMVLPVNWRSSLSFEEGGYMDEAEDPTMNPFRLRDITPESLPSVRNVISDILLDIPYYLSHHQPKMIAAVVTEANRIFDLWCKNNPTFMRQGRVHLIAHSLGSVMAIDILSKQPTSIRHSMEHFNVDATSAGHFSFDTTNLFVCGSPAGFFLLLRKAGLLPRRNRSKPSADGEDQMPGVAADQGRYGCLAVDNIYNIINPYDPVAYRLNATVDTDYAATIKPAFVPSASNSWFSFGNPFRYRGGATTTGASRPPLTQRLPSNVELETHNFTREEIAEKRIYLLNDNGQIDYLLRYGGGPFEIQYLTMLGAHSSYWLSQDFVRFVVVECGRTPGKLGTLNALRAVKKKAYAI